MKSLEQLYLFTFTVSFPGVEIPEEIDVYGDVSFYENGQFNEIYSVHDDERKEFCPAVNEAVERHLQNCEIDCVFIQRLEAEFDNARKEWDN